MRKAFSVVEVLLAAGLFSIFSVGLVALTAQGLQANRTSQEQAIANQFAVEGIEAVRSIKNQNFSNLIDTASTGATVSGGVWTFSGTNNVFDKYTRVISISPIDADTKKIISTVSWGVTSARNVSLQLISYLTNWRKAILSLGGLLIYGDGTTTPKFRSYDSSTDTFGAQSATLAVSSGNTFVIRTSPLKSEAIAGYVTSAGVLNILCYDGTNWTNEWNVNVGGTGATRPFDISFETNSGDAMVLYSTNTPTNNELAYRTKAGSAGCGSANWATATNLSTARTNGTVQWVKMAGDRRGSSNLITAIWADNQSDLSAMVWSGTGWGNEPSAALATALQVVANAQDVEDFDVEYESTSGDVMVVWGVSVGSNANGVRYSTCTNGTATCSWSAVLTPPTFVDDATHLDLSANPNSDELVFASIGLNQSDLQIGYWSGSAWTNTANADTSCNPPIAGTEYVSTGWLIAGATTRSFIRYFDQGSSAVDWYTGSASVFTKQADWIQSPAPNNPVFVDVQMNPISKDQLMTMVSDNANDLFVKRLVMDSAGNFTWTNTDGTILTATLPQAINSPFSFAYWRN